MTAALSASAAAMAVVLSAGRRPPGPPRRAASQSRANPGRTQTAANATKLMPRSESSRAAPEGYAGDEHDPSDQDKWHGGKPGERQARGGRGSGSWRRSRAGAGQLPATAAWTHIAASGLADDLPAGCLIGNAGRHQSGPGGENESPGDQQAAEKPGAAQTNHPLLPRPKPLHMPDVTHVLTVTRLPPPSPAVYRSFRPAPRARWRAQAASAARAAARPRRPPAPGAAACPGWRSSACPGSGRSRCPARRR